MNVRRLNEHCSMDLKHFGDSHDVVKKSLLQWLSRFGPWAAHPMFTHEVSEAEAMAFARFLGIPLVSTDVLRQESERGAYLAACGGYPSIFLDPDTGVRIHRREPGRSTEFVFDDELLAIAKARPSGLVLVFDQSVARGSERQDMQAKLDHFATKGLSGFSYVAQACFVILGSSRELVQNAHRELVLTSGLPADRMIFATPRNPPLEPMVNR